MSEPDYKEIRNRITRRYEDRAEFFGHLIAFIVVNFLLWSGMVGIRQGPLLTGFTALWLMGLMIHLINFLLREARERAIERAIERERGWTQETYQGQKPKREGYAHLSDDGELVEIVDEDEIYSQVADKRR